MPFDSAPEIKSDDLVVKIANYGADYLELWGWCQGTGTTRLGARCIINVISFIAGSYVSTSLSKRELIEDTVKRLGFRGGSMYDNVVSWNDDPNRTKEEVIAKLRSVK